MMQALSLPACGPLRPRPLRSTEVDLGWIAGQLGLLRHERRTIIRKVRLLAEQCAFPLPKNPRFVGAERKTGAEAIDAASVWDRDAVERWLENDRPPAESAALAVERRSSARDEMRRRTLELVRTA